MFDINKPFENNLIREQVSRIVDAVLETDNIFINLTSVSEEGNYLFHQATTTCIYSILLGQTQGYSRPKLVELGIGALLADIGMTEIPAAILEKNEKLTEDEFKKIKTHPLIGYKILVQNAKLKNSIAVVALQHHENYDGSGYPRAIKENRRKRAR